MHYKKKAVIQIADALNPPKRSSDIYFNRAEILGIKSCLQDVKLLSFFPTRLFLYILWNMSNNIVDFKFAVSSENLQFA